LLNKGIDQNFNDVTSPYNMFKYSIRTELTRKYYERRIRTFFDFIDFMVGSAIEARCNLFAERAKSDAHWAIVRIINFLQYEKERVQREEITAATLTNFVKSLKLYSEMAEILIPWKKITRGLPRAGGVANDRAPKVEEIRQLIQYPDRRIKPILYTMASSGIRLGAWDYLKWKHIIPLRNEAGQVLAAKIIVYAGESEEYYAFITPEAYNSLLAWMEFRSKYGEKITGDSWVMRDIWQTSNMKYGAKFGLATNPKKLKSSGIKRLIEQALWEQGIRTKLKQGTKRHEWKAAHGFRKFYKTRTEQVMKPINVEITMGHNIGLSSHYYRPSFEEVKADYLKAVELLTIDSHDSKLEKQITELKQKNKENEYIISGKLHEKDEEMEGLKEQQLDSSEAIAVLSDRLTKALEDIEFLKKTK
jgi:hypothetical protein